jgi:hypothetical protein
MTQTTILLDLAQAIYELKPTQSIRAVVSDGMIYVFRETRISLDRYALAKIEYFARGHWHDTEEGVEFSKISPFAPAGLNDGG